MALPEAGTVVPSGSLKTIRHHWLSAGWFGAQFYVYKSVELDDDDEWLRPVLDQTRDLVFVGSVEIPDENMMFGMGVLSAYRPKGGNAPQRIAIKPVPKVPASV